MLQRAFVLCLSIALFGFAPAPLAMAAQRVALVIGNDAYDSLPDLQKAVNDARAVAGALSELGFVVDTGENLTRRAMARKLADLEATISPGDEVFFFFAGHGVAIGPSNYLIPIDMPQPRAGEESLVADEAQAADTIVRRIQARGAAVAMIVLDACRDNPFAAAGVRSIGSTRGLARIEATKGVFVLFSAGIGQTALDRLSDSDTDPNSVFTRKLVPLLKTPGMSHVDLAKQVQHDVDALAATVHHAQQPAYYDQIIGRIVLRRINVEAAEPQGDVLTAVAIPPAASKPDATGPKTLTIRVRLGSKDFGGKPGTALGVQIADAKSDWLRAIGSTNEGAALVTSVEANGAAASAGVQALDLVTKLDGKPVTTARGLAELVATRPVGLEVDVEIYRLGDGPEQSHAEIARRAGAGDIGAMSFLGHLYSFEDSSFKNETESARWHVRAAEAGDASSMLRLGQLYFSGYGVTKNVDEGLRWWRRAAEAGDTAAMLSLARTYRDGTGVGTDAAEAVRWFRLAADRGDTEAMLDLAYLYSAGGSVGKDEAEASRWYQHAAGKGHAGAMTQIAFRYETGLGLSKDEVEAVKWYRLAAERGEIYSMAALGVMLRDGRGTAKDGTEALRWLQQAAATGDVWAMTNLGYMYELGLGIAKNEAEAFNWYRQSTEKGDVWAKTSLAYMYSQGRGTAQNVVEAARLFREASDQGNARSMYGLARALELGEGVGKDSTQAAQWMYRSLELGDEYSYNEMTTNSRGWSPAFRKALQSELRNAGLYSGKTDGAFGPGVMQALSTLVSRARQ